MGRLDSKTAVISGGAMGMGFGSACVMGRQGARIAILDKSPQIQDSVEKLRKEGIEAIGFSVDVRDSDAVKNAMNQCIAHYGKIDILVNTAGIAIIEPFLEMSDASRDLIFDINIKGMWNTCRAILPHMVENNYGKIVNFSSVTGYMVADAGEAAYGTTKASIIGMTKCLAAEFVKNNITVNAVCPGYVRTPMVEAGAKEFFPENPEAFFEGLSAGIPLGRLGTIEEAGDLVAFLASDDSRYITGTQVVFDGASTLPETQVVSV